MEVLFFYLPIDWENKLLNLLSFVGGLVLNTLFPRWRVTLLMENLMFPIMFRRINAYNPLTIKRQRRKLEDLLIKLGEVYYLEGASHVGLWFIYTRKRKLTTSMIYKQSLIEHLVLVKSDFKHLTYTKEEQEKIFSQDFPGYLVYQGSVGNSLNSSTFDTTLLVPRYDRETRKIYFSFTVSFLHKPKDQNGQPIPFVPTPLQLMRTKELIKEVHSSLTTY